MMMRIFSIFFIFFIFSASHALADESTGIAIENITIAPGDTASLPITIEGANEIAGGSLKLFFNPEIISVQSVSPGDFGTPIYNIGNDFVSISLAGANAAGKTTAAFAVVAFKGLKTGSSPLRIEDADLNKEDGSTLSPGVTDGMIIVEGETEEAPAASSASREQPAEPVKTAEPQKPSSTPTTAPEVQNNSEVLITPAQTEEETQQEKAVETPALSWIFVVGILVAESIIRRRYI